MGFLFVWYFRNISLLEALPIFGLMVENYMYSIPMEVVKIWMYRVVEYSSVELNMILDITMVIIILEMYNLEKYFILLLLEITAIFST